MTGVLPAMQHLTCRDTWTVGQRSSSNSHLQAKKNMTKTRELTLKTVDSSRASKSGWNSRVSIITCRSLEKRRTQYQLKL